ncbi:hypothetical protein [Ottowia sp.]|uniref:hypothetical protein n=1 Tax=Ottowia sp. TaxID=1898956 RepID=UPI0025EE89C0|nr:hypothetical protein [Ottowia sp.]MBK6616512.1 hypothetical protein [Ottowia sp.]
MDYDFGDGIEVVDASGWEHTSLGREWTRAVFVAADQGDTCGTASTKLTFTVRFVHGTVEVEEVYAIDAKGSIWGTSGAPVDLANVRIVIDAAYQCDPGALSDLKTAIESAVFGVIGGGLLSHGPFTPNGYETQVISIGKAAKDLDEDEVRDWLGGMLESGNTRLEDVPKLMSRYALTDSFQMRSELAERMGRE